jgi:D-galacturonate reductase
MSNPEILIVGGGMITHDQLLPAVYHMQRQGRLGGISVCSQHLRTVRALKASTTLAEAFPGQSFRAYPESGDPDRPQPELYRQAIERMKPGGIVIVAVPDHLHFNVIMAALRHGLHVCAVKPLVLRYEEALEVQREAYERGLVVGVEYHKRFDDRNLIARRKYRAGLFGEFRLGSAWLLEKAYYRRSNFQNWFTTDNSDAFTYVGCHYVDLVHFITGLEPKAVSVYGIPDRFPNGKSGYLWTDARVIWSNGACLNVQNALGFPDNAPGANAQGLVLYCQGANDGAWISHSDQLRGVRYSYAETGAGPTAYAEPNPDYFQYLDLGGAGLTPAGYGFRSVEYILQRCIQVEAEGHSLAARQKLLQAFDSAGLMATPRNSSHNERVIEAARESILSGGRTVEISGATAFEAVASSSEGDYRES